MSDATDSHRDIGSMMTPDVARDPRPTYRSLVEDAPVLRIDGVGVLAARGPRSRRSCGIRRSSRRTRRPPTSRPGAR